jgi:hypothetical protein
MNKLEFNSESNLASLGQFGVRQKATGEDTTTDEKFMAVYANEDSDFTTETYSGGDSSFTVKLKAGGSIAGAFKNITSVTGDILCIKSEA